MGRCNTEAFLCGLYAGAHGSAGAAGRNVYKADTVEYAVYGFGLCLKRGGDNCIVRPARRKQRSGDLAEPGKYLTDSFKASFLAGRCVHCADDVGCRHAGRLKAFAADAQARRGGCGFGYKCDNDVAVIIVLG